MDGNSNKTNRESLFARLRARFERLCVRFQEWLTPHDARDGNQ
jgi:hypothetical protein